jgi:putative membrane protein
MRLSFVAAAIAAVIHVGFFALESFLFTKPVGRKIFRTTPADAETMKFFAFNQGFYNRFLAIGCAVGIALAIEPLVMFTCASMVGAAAVLATGGKQFLRGVALQGVPPLVALVGLVTS